MRRLIASATNSLGMITVMRAQSRGLPLVVVALTLAVYAIAATALCGLGLEAAVAAQPAVYRGGAGTANGGCRWWRRQRMETECI